RRERSRVRLRGSNEGGAAQFLQQARLSRERAREELGQRAREVVRQRARRIVGRPGRWVIAQLRRRIVARHGQRIVPGNERRLREGAGQLVRRRTSPVGGLLAQQLRREHAPPFLGERIVLDRPRRIRIVQIFARRVL